MKNNYKNIITQLKIEVKNNNLFDYLKNNFTRITNCGVGEQYEKDFNLTILATQTCIKILYSKEQNIIVEFYEYDKAPRGYFITYNKLDTFNCDIFI